MLAKNTQSTDVEGHRRATGAVLPHEQSITARLAAAGSRRAELEQVLAAAPTEAPLHVYRELVVADNIAGKASEVTRLKLFRQLRERYRLDSSSEEFRAFRWAIRLAPNAHDRGLACFLMMARSDRLFRDLSLQIVEHSTEGSVIDSMAVEDYLKSVLSGESTTWSADTIEHVRQHVLAALKDFGVLHGSQTKTRVAFRPGPVPVAFGAHLAKAEGNTGRQTLSSKWFRLLGLDEERAADGLRAAHRAGLLTFRMQADVVELELPELAVA